MEIHQLGSILTLLLICCGVAIVAQWVRQPYTIALVLVGCLIASSKITPSIYITHDVIFALILPPLLFQGALHMDLERLKNNWKSIALLAIPGVVASTVLVGLMINRFLGIDWIYALLFGALMAPTDPISVLSILKKVGAPERLRTILEGESLFNDGTGVVIFSVILGIITGHENFHFGQSVARFLIVMGGGAILGMIIGVVTYHLLRKINDHLIEVTITVVVTFGTPLLAEAFHLSGIIALVIAGLIIGNYGRMYSMSKKTRETLETFWEVVDFIVNSLLFLVIGIELQVFALKDFSFYVQPILISVGAVLFARLIVVYPIIWLRNRLSHEDIPFAWNHVLFWGGLKGSIPIALVVGLPADVQYRSFMLIVAFSVVLFSLVVQGLTIKPLMRGLGITDQR